MRNILMVLVAFLLLGCAEERSASGDLTGFIPENSVVIIDLEDPDLFFSNLRNSEFLRENKSHSLYREMEEKLAILDLIPHTNPALLTLSFTGEDSFDFTFISRGAAEIPNLDSIPNKMIESFSTEDHIIKKYTIEDQVAFSTEKDSIYIFSNSRSLLETTLFEEKTLYDDPDFQKAMKAASGKHPSVYINHKKLQPLLKKWFPKKDLSFIPGFSNWTSVDAEITQNSIKLNGISTATDTLPNLINVFKGTSPSSNLLATVTPVDATGFYSVTYNDFNRFLQNLTPLQKGGTDKNFPDTKELLEITTEAGTVFLEGESVFILRTFDPEGADLLLSSESEVPEDFRGNSIYKYSDNGSFRELLYPLFSPEGLQHYTRVEDFLMFSSSSEALKDIITAYQNEKVLAKNEAYISTFGSLSTDASVLVVSNNSGFKNVLSGMVSEAFKSSTNDLDFENYPITALQFIYQDNYAHVHGVMMKNSAPKTKNSTAQIASVKLDAAPATNPVFFRNHRSKGMDVAVQDIENTLYLISPSGKIYWKKKMDSRILGEIHSIDILKNGRYQLAFATQNQLHVIDRNGNPVKPFPHKFRDAITQPLAVFDYDNNRDYRFVIVQGKEVLMYDNKGRRVKGFKYSKATDEVVHAPKHIRLGRKDYILIPEASGKLNILSRTGQIRVPVKEKISFSENNWYEYKGNFTTTNQQGELVQVTEQGKVNVTNYSLSDTHHMTATSKTLVTLNENTLTIRDKTITLDFGLYTEPRIFYLNNKIYVSLTDTQTQKVYLFDSNGELLSGFPVYGNSVADLANATGNSAPELVVLDENDGILIYEVK
ncbi:hypothetical protein [Salinimicrobium flavum]|uniref:Uncharacterized protein n=1 Tax=Salinimicrobium flavum TaxID=1737065 RepID=A0ABW5IVH4_9FLAO